MRRITITYGIITPESAAEGDYAETGWENEEGIPIEPDEYDIEEEGGELAAVVKASCEAITNACGCVEASSSDYHDGVWYSSIDPERDYSDGSEKYYSAHLEGFTTEEEQAIFDKLKGGL